jgi:hypothetical protein
MLRLVTAVAVAGLLMAGCGGEDSSPEAGSPVEGKRGGKLTMLWTDDVDNIDPGITYYQMGYMVAYATQRPLYSYRPDDGERAVARPRGVRPAGLRGRADRHRHDPEGRALLPAREPRGEGGGRQVRDRARLLQDRQQRLRRHILRRPRGR